MIIYSMVGLPGEIQKQITINGISGCWHWMGRRAEGGYGSISWAGRTMGAHRVVYEFLVGRIPDGKHLDHRCWHPVCVNPAHLEPVSPRENQERKHRARGQAGFGPKPVHVPSTRLPKKTASAETADHLANILKVMRGERRVRTQAVLARLIQLDAALYDTWSFRTLATTLRFADVTIRRYEGNTVIRLEEIKKAAGGTRRCAGPTCDAPLVGGSDSVYCSGRCRQAAYRDRKGADADLVAADSDGLW